MTLHISGKDLAETMNNIIPDAVYEWNSDSVWVKPEMFAEAAQTLRKHDRLLFDLLVNLTAVDYIGYFEVVYHLRSLQMNTFAVVKVRTGIGRDTPSVPSVYHIWRGADLQEREAWDLMGIYFEGHPNLKRIMLWENFPGHPLRKDFITYEQSIKVDED